MDGGFDYWNHGDPLMDELKEAAFEYLLLNPGSEFGDWRQGLIEQYPTEVVDALGSNPEEVYSDLADLWESEYYDRKSGQNKSLADWAATFASEQVVTYTRPFHVPNESQQSG